MKPLDGIKVLELATVVAAPTAARVLGYYGADVVKIEKLDGDSMRRTGVQEKVVCEDYKNPLFTVVNSNKKLLALDITAEEGKNILFKLLEQADVFLTNVRMGSLRKRGLDYDSLKENFPQLVYAHFSGYGPAGPAAQNPGFDITTFWARSGPLADWNVEGAPPMHPTYAFGDFATSSMFVSGVLMALIARQKTGKGTMVNTSLYGTGIWCNSTAVISSQPQFGKPTNPHPLRPDDPFSSFYQCKDGRYIGVYCNEYEKDREKIAAVIGVAEAFKDPRCCDVPTLLRTGAMEEVVGLLNEVFQTRTAGEWNELFIQNNIANGIAYSAKDVCQDEQAIANKYVEEVEFAGNIKVMMPNPPIQFSEYGHRPYEPTGKIGEHTDEILGRLGYTQEELRSLKEKGVVE